MKILKLFLLIITCNIIISSPKTELISTLETLREKTGAPGAAIGIINGKRTEIICIGNTDFSKNAKPVDANTVYPLASLSKLYVAYMAKKQTKLHLTDPLNKHFKLELPQHPQPHALTIADILSHSTRLARFDALWELDNKRNPEDFLSSVPLTEPGVGKSYNNILYSILARRIAQLNGTNWSNYCRTSIFEPLGMTHSGYFESVKEKTVAPPHAWIRRKEYQTLPHFKGCTIDPAISMYSSITDFIKFTKSWLEQKGPHQTILDLKRNISYGYNDGNTSVIRSWDNNQKTVVILTNCSNDDFIDTLLEACSDYCDNELRRTARYSKTICNGTYQKFYKVDESIPCQEGLYTNQKFQFHFEVKGNKLITPTNSFDLKKHRNYYEAYLSGTRCYYFNVLFQTNKMVLFGCKSSFDKHLEFELKST